MMKRRLYIPLAIIAVALVALGFLFMSGQSSQAQNAAANQVSEVRSAGGQTAIYRGVLPVAHFDVSPPLAVMGASGPQVIPPASAMEGRDRPTGLEGKPGTASGRDTTVQSILGALLIPTPIVSF